MIFLAIALLLRAQGTQAQPSQAQPSQGQPPTPKAYSGPHTLAKTWGDLYPGLRTPAKPVHGSGTGVKPAAGTGVGNRNGASAALPEKGSTMHAAAKRTAAPGTVAPKTYVAPKTSDAANASGASTIKPANSAAGAASAQMTFYNGANKTGDGRMDVMHFRDGKMAVTMGKDWNCSYVNDEQQHRVVIICDGQRSPQQHP